MSTSGGPVVVCRKAVDLRPEIDSLTGEVMTDPRRWGASHADDAALEWGLRLGQLWSVEVIAVTVGPEKAEIVCREAIAAGADRAVRIDVGTEEAGGPDGVRGSREHHLPNGLSGSAGIPSFQVAQTLAALASSDDASAVVCGDISLDRGSGSVPSYIAHLLGIPQALGLLDVEPIGPGADTGGSQPETGGTEPSGEDLVSAVTSSGDRDVQGHATSVPGDAHGREAAYCRDKPVIVKRRLEGGRAELLRITKPCVLSFEGGSTTLRRASVENALLALSAPIEVIAPDSAAGPTPKRLSRDVADPEIAAVPNGRNPAVLPTSVTLVATGPHRPPAEVVNGPAPDQSAWSRVVALTQGPALRRGGDPLTLEPLQAAKKIVERLTAWGHNDPGVS